jgi:FkbM family methyltransferase
MNNALYDLRRDYEKGLLAKLQYNEEQWKTHVKLFDYQFFLEGTNVRSIKITDSGVVLRLWEPDIRFKCSNLDHRHVAFTSLNFRHYEAMELKHVLRLARGAKTIIDIGANTGFYAMALAQAFPKAEVIAFEPIQTTYSQLVGNIRLNKIKNVEAFPIGLYNTNGKTTFYCDPQVPGATSAAPLGPEFGEPWMFECPVETLNGFCIRTGIVPDFIKCDVEGAELLVFRGAIEVLKSAKPIIFTEMLRKWAQRFNYHPNDLMAFLSSLGYECFVLREGELQPFLEMTEDTVETNFFFMHPDRRL